MLLTLVGLFLFFFQAEDGIRDYKVTGVQTCALPICDPYARGASRLRPGEEKGLTQALHARKATLALGARLHDGHGSPQPSPGGDTPHEIGRASCRERG